MPATTTRLLCLEDASLETCDAIVIGSDPGWPGSILDQTIFYPGGGGQPADTGVIERPQDGRSWRIGGVKRLDGQVIHLIEATDSDLPVVGDRVRVVVDWDRRYRLMRTHTALHVLCGVVYRDFGAQVTGGNMDVDKARMDFELEDFTPELANLIEERTNTEIATAREVRVATLPREEAFQIPDLIRTKINLLPPGIEIVRIVEIVGLDLQADGGTHVQNTREVGGIRVIGTRSKGRINKRLEIELIDPVPYSSQELSRS